MGAVTIGSGGGGGGLYSGGMYGFLATGGMTGTMKSGSRLSLEPCSGVDSFACLSGCILVGFSGVCLEAVLTGIGRMMCLGLSHTTSGLASLRCSACTVRVVLSNKCCMTKVDGDFLFTMT